MRIITIMKLLKPKVNSDMGIIFGHMCINDVPPSPGDVQHWPGRHARVVSTDRICQTYILRKGLCAMCVVCLLVCLFVCLFVCCVWCGTVCSFLWLHVVHTTRNNISASSPGSHGPVEWTEKWLWDAAPSDQNIAPDADTRSGGSIGHICAGAFCALVIAEL